MPRQSCIVCAWRESCAKRFCVTDGGGHCPDYSRDVSIKDADEEEIPETDSKELPKK